MNLRGGLSAFLGLAGLWMLLLALFAGWPGFIFVIVGIICLGALAIRYRSHPAIVAVWIPAMVLTGLAALTSFLIAATALTVLVGYHPQDLFGALSGAVFVLAAIPITVGGVVAGSIFFFCFKYRPTNYPQPLTSLAIINTLAVLVFVVMNHQTLFVIARDPMIVRVLDSEDRPISQVKVEFDNYMIQANGATEPKPDESGVLLTDDKGEMRFSPDCLARHIVLHFSKAGYAKINATIENNDVGMGDQGHRAIHCRIEGQEEDAAQTDVSNKHPIEMKFYLPTDHEAPSPPRKLSFVGSWPSSGEIYLNLDDGTMSDTPSGDLKFEIYQETEPNRPTKFFRVAALNGASLAPSRMIGVEGIENESLKFDDIVSVGRSVHLSNDLQVDWLNEFYFRSADGKQYAKIELSDLGDHRPPYARGPKGKISLWTIGTR